MRVPGAWSGWLLGACVLGVGLVALADVFRGDEPAAVAPFVDAPGDVLGGPYVPGPGLLPGSLTFVAADTCGVATLDLATAVMRRTGPSSCDLWVAPGGDIALVSAARQGSRYELWLASLGDSPRLLRRLGLARGEPSWSSDATVVAWCTPNGVTRTLDLRAGSERSVAGCAPRFAPDGDLLTRPDRPVASAVLREGRVALAQSDLARGFAAGPPPGVDVLGVDEDGGGLLAVAVASVGQDPAAVVLELWRGEQLVAARPLPVRLVPGVGALGELLRFSPTGNELAIGFPRPAFGLMVLDVRSGRVVREASPTRGFAWSPDGRWLAVATRDEIVIAGAVRAETTYALPLAVGAMAWS